MHLGDQRERDELHASASNDNEPRTVRIARLTTELQAEIFVLRVTTETMKAYAALSPDDLSALIGFLSTGRPAGAGLQQGSSSTMVRGPAAPSSTA